MVEMTAAMKAFSWPEELRHAPKSPDPDNRGGFSSACRCGYPGKSVKSSPSHAYQATRVHAETENRREANGGKPKPMGTVDLPDTIALGEDAPGGALWGGGARRPSRASVGSSRPSRGGPATPCGCGCGEPSGGLFRPGHDSKLLSRLLNSIRSGAQTLAEAHEEMDKIGTSQKLKDKLAGKWGHA